MTYSTRDHALIPSNRSATYLRLNSGPNTGTTYSNSTKSYNITMSDLLEGKVELDPTVDFVAGTAAGISGLVVGFPLDTGKCAPDPVAF
ncbi:hypothetical protein E4T56_gene15468 [Termitomyces sp. T112]|nr:hypothetical protein E4T56_gene15468 [Termitomyces sp. T112]